MGLRLRPELDRVAQSADCRIARPSVVLLEREGTGVAPDPASIASELWRVARVALAASRARSIV
jgi:hypothetical protein